MASPTGSRKRAQPATHPTVYVGLLLAIGGLILAIYAYTGTRIYDITFAYVAVGGGACALLGILVSAWGRAIMASRAQRARRGAAREAVERAPATPEAPAAEAAPRKRGFGFGKRPAPETPQPPTVAAPADKPRPRLAFGRKTKSEGNVFSFRRQDPRGAGSAAQSVVEPARASNGATAPDATPAGMPVRITLKCPRCATQFDAEGVQPISIQCPSCGLTGAV